jgi:hypothetical protein
VICIFPIAFQLKFGILPLTAIFKIAIIITGIAVEKHSAVIKNAAGA